MAVFKHREGPEKPEMHARLERVSRPRLMYVLGLAPQKIGGIEKFLRYFVTALDAAGWDAVLCFDGPIADEFREYICFPFVTIESLDGQGNLGLACAGELWRLLRKHKPRAFVYAFNGVMRCFPWLARMAGCRQVFFNDHSSRPYGQAAAPLSLPKRMVGRVLTWPVTAIVSVSDFTRRAGNALCVTSARNVVVPNGVEVHEMDPRRRTEFRSRYGINGGDIVITQVCWMVKEKGVDTMLRAAAALLRERAGVHFLFVGNGSDIERYKNLATELGIGAAVTFTGLLNNPTGMGVFDASDIYCQASIWQEASGLGVLEAMSVRLPVVASETGGLPENVLHGCSGFLVPVGSSEEICAALKKLVDDADLRRSMGEAGFQLVLKEHRIEETARRYVDVFTGGGSAPELRLHELDLQNHMVRGAGSGQSHLNR
jgi:glycosyltransferase involved in cell wall biosynthesis